MTDPVRIGPGGDVLIERADGHTTVRRVRHDAGAGDPPAPPARIEGEELQGGRVTLGGWGITEALRRGARAVTADGVADGGLVTGISAWHFGWDRTDWDELASAVVAGRILARAGADTVIEMHGDGSFVVTPATIDGITAHVLDGFDAPDLVEPDATVRLYTVRLTATDADGVFVHSVRGLPAPATAVIELDEPAGWQASATFGVVGLDPEATATRVWDAAGGAVEVRFTRRERPDPATWADTVAELRATVVHDDAAEAERTMVEAVAAIVGAGLPGVSPLTARPPMARPISARRALPVPAGEVDHAVLVGDERIAIPPAPTKPPPLARRTSEAAAAPPPASPPRKVAPSVSTHPETIAALRDDLGRRRLAAGPAEDDSVHWDAQPTSRAALGRLARASAGRCWRDGTESVSLALWVGSADAYDWLQWHLDADRFRAMLPAEAMATIHRVELPNLNALGFVLSGGVEAPAELLGEYVRAREVDLPDELYPSSALRTSAT
jgi:hypothetical protein